MKADSPSSVATPYNKKPKTPEKEAKEPEVEKAEVDSIPITLASEPAVDISATPPVDLPIHYKRLVDDLRLLDETLSILRVQNQIPFFSTIKTNIERVSGRRFSLDHFRQLMTASAGGLFRVEWQDVKDVEGRAVRSELTIRAIDHEREGVEIFKRMTPDQSKARNAQVVDFLTAKLNEYLKKDEANTAENAYPIKPFELPDNALPSSTAPQTPGRERVLAKCDSTASNGPKTPKSSLRRQLSVSASPVVPNSLPQFISTPVKLPDPDRPGSTTPAPPMSAKEKLEAIRNRVKAREQDDVQEAKAYDKEMARREKLDEYDLSVKLLIKLHHKFPRGITTAKMSTLKKDFGSLFVSVADVERFTRKICELVPERFELETIGEELVLKFKGCDIKFSQIKKEIEDLKIGYETSLRE